MPPRRVARRSERNTAGTNRAASVPVGRPGNSRLETLRSNNQRFLDVEDAPLNIVITRGRKRDSSSCATPQVDCIAGASTSGSTMASVAANVSEQRPQKRRRSSSTPAAPRLPQLAAQLRSRRSSRSRAGSPTTISTQCILPSRGPSRLARKIHSFIGSRDSDIYTHLAGPDGAKTLLGEPPTCSVVSSAPDGMVNSQSVQKPRGRRRKVVDLTDENAKKDLMEEWARIRQSQGTLPLSGIDENARLGRMPLCDTRKDSEPFSSVQLGATTRRHTPEFMENQGTILDDSRTGSSTRIGSENTLPTGRDREKSQHIGSPLPSEQPVVSSVDIETLPTLDAHPYAANGKGATADGLVAPEGATSLALLQPPGSSALTLPAPLFREDSIVTTLPINEQAILNGPSKDSHSASFSEAYSLNDSDTCPGFGEGFYMLDVPEIFTLPWEPVQSHLYVPPSLGKLISGMREQLTIEARARQRVEELYHTELNRRISAEKIIDDLRAELADRQRDSFGRTAY